MQFQVVDLDDSLFKIKCGHQLAHIVGDPRNANMAWHCNKITDIILKEYAQNKIISKESFVKYMTYITPIGGYYYCARFNNTFANVFNVLFNFYCPSIAVINMILVNSTFDRCFKVLAHNWNLPKEYYIAVITCRLTSVDNSFINDYLVKFVFKNCPIDMKILELLCLCKSYYIARLTSNMIDKFDGDLSETCIHNVYRALPYSQELIQSLEYRNIGVSSKCFEIVCQYCSELEIEQIWKTYNIVISQEHFLAILKRDLTMNEYTFMNLVKNKLLMLMKCGYALTWDDILVAKKMSLDILLFVQKAK